MSRQRDLATPLAKQVPKKSADEQNRREKGNGGGEKHRFVRLKNFRKDILPLLCVVRKQLVTVSAQFICLRNRQERTIVGAFVQKVGGTVATDDRHQRSCDGAVHILECSENTRGTTGSLYVSCDSRRRPVERDRRDSTRAVACPAQLQIYAMMMISRNC